MRGTLLLEIIKEYVKNSNEKETHIDVAKKIIDDGKSDLSLRTLRKKIAEYRSGGDEIESHGEEEEARWRVEDDYYYIKRKKHEVKFPVKLTDKIFLDYSKHGYNLSSTQVIHKYDLSVEEWHTIKAGLRLFKDSDIISPYTLQTTPVEELQEVIELSVEKLFRNKVVTEKAWEKTLHNEYKKTIQEDNFRHLELTAFMDKITEELPHFVPVQLKSVIIKDDKPKECTLVITDLHIGAETEKLSRTPRFDLDVLKQRLAQIAKEVNQMNYSKVNVTVLGDLIESFTGLNHKNSWKGIQRGLWGANLLTVAYEVLVEFINSLNNFGTMYVVSGNHDRSTSDNKEDVTGEIAKIITYFLTKTVGQDRCVDCGYISSFKMGNINIIPTHGDLWLSRQNAATMAWKYGIQGMFNLILEGHLHSRIIKKNDDGLDFRKIICPSVFSGNMYSDQGGWDSTGGYLIIEETDNGSPRIIDCSL
jgi:hypothetical protein